MKSADVVICGSGIAGVSAAYHLAVREGIHEVVLVDDRAPLSLTSDKSTECYRNWWPGPGNAMVALMNRSIDILEELSHAHGNPFNLNRRGYVFATSDPERIEVFRQQGEEAAELGSGPLRVHDGHSPGPVYEPAPAVGFDDLPVGSDLITDGALIREHFPYLNENTVGLIHARRAGWFAAQQLGALLLDLAREAGVRLVEGRVAGVELTNGAISSVKVDTRRGGAEISTHNFVNAAGPYLNQVGKLLGVELPVFAELHGKVAIHDRVGAFPRGAPMLIWTDPQHLPWTAAERQELEGDENGKFLLEEFPQGAHGRPEGPLDGDIALLIWTYDTDPVQPTFPLQFDPLYPEIALRGVATMLPAFEAYFDAPPKPVVDGGYYIKTQENRLLAGPLPIEGSWIIGALSGYGLMASPAAGEMLAAQIAGREPPDYSRWFRLDRYDDSGYQKLLANWGRSGQL